MEEGKHYSWSQLQDFFFCAEMYRRKVIERDIRPRPAKVVKGTAAHKYMEKYMWWFMNGQEAELREMERHSREFIEDAFNKEVEKTEEGITYDDAGKDLQIDWAEQAALVFVENVVPKVKCVWNVEERVAWEILPGINWVGYIDLVYTDMVNQMWMADYKVKDKRPKDGDSLMQLESYVLSLEKLTDVREPIDFIEINAAYPLTKGMSFCARQYNRPTEKRLEVVENLFITSIKQIEAGIFPLSGMNHAWYCDERYCNYYADCQR